MSVPHVLLIESDSLLDHGIESVLLRQPDVRLSSVSYTGDPAFLRDLVRIRPDMILLNEAGPVNAARLFDLLANVPDLATLRVIVVRPDGNTIDLYEKRSIVATQSSDLLSLIQPAENRPGLSGIGPA